MERSTHIFYELQVLEEEEKGREEEQDTEREIQGEEKRSDDTKEMESKGSLLKPRCVCG